MKTLDANVVKKYVEENISSFHNKRLENLKKLKLKKVLSRKNPYLFKAKHILTAEELVKSLLDAHLSSNEETIFGEFLEALSIFINKKVFGGNKSAAEGIDLEFENKGIKYIVTIKSGPNWGNHSQIQKMRDNFRKAKRILGTNTLRQNIVAVNGCCYGKNKNQDRGDYLKICGQDFWEFISGDPNLYVELIEPLGYKAKIRNEEFLESYSKIINIFTQEFSSLFVDDGIINWKALVEFNSSSSNSKE